MCQKPLNVLRPQRFRMLLSTKQYEIFNPVEIRVYNPRTHMNVETASKKGAFAMSITSSIKLNCTTVQKLDVQKKATLFLQTNKTNNLN